MAGGGGQEESRTIFEGGSAAEVVPQRLLESDKGLQNTKFGLTRRVLPCKQGGGGSKGYRLCRRPLFELVLARFVLFVMA